MIRIILGLIAAALFLACKPTPAPTPEDAGAPAPVEDAGAPAAADGGSTTDAG